MDRSDEDTRVVFMGFEKRPTDPVFHSAYSEEVFKHCTICEKQFAQGAIHRHHVVMKTFVHDETILELAICEQCREAMASEVSTESRQQMDAFARPRMRYRGTIDLCALCDRPRTDCRSWTVYAHCIGADMFVDGFPFMFCDRCENTIQELLSEDTRGWQDDFIDQHFSGPDIALDPTCKPVLI